MLFKISYKTHYVQDTLLNLGQRNNKSIQLHARISFGFAGVVGDGSRYLTKNNLIQIFIEKFRT